MNRDEGNFPLSTTPVHYPTSGSGWNSQTALGTPHRVKKSFQYSQFSANCDLKNIPLLLFYVFPYL